MKSLKSTALAWLLATLSTLGISAQSVNRLVIPDVEIPSKSYYAHIPVILENTDQIVAAQFDLKIFSESLGRDEGYWDRISVTTTDRSEGHEFSQQANVSEDGYFRLRVVSHSVDNKPFRGNAGPICYIHVNYFNELPKNLFSRIEVENLILATADAVNVAAGSAAGVMKVVPAPYLTIEEVSVDKDRYKPGDTIKINWTVANEGTSATGPGWSEELGLLRIYNFEYYEWQPLTKVYCDDVLAPGATTQRSAEVVIPDAVGISGNVQVSVSVVPTAQTGTDARSGSMNSSRFYLEKTLKADIPATIMEGATATRCTLTRSGETSGSTYVNFNLIKGDDRLIFPEEVVIPSGESSTVFYLTTKDNKKLDSDNAFIFEISSYEYPAITCNFTMIDKQNARLHLSIDNEELTEGDEFMLHLTSEITPVEDVVITLDCDTPSRFDYVRRHTLKAGESSLDIPVKAIDNEAIENEVLPTFVVSAPDFITGRLTVALHDNDMPDLELILSPTSVSESAGPHAIKAIVRRTSNLNTVAKIKLSDNLAGALSYPSTITLEKGVQEAEFSVGVIDNAKADGDRTVTLSAAVYLASCSCSAGSTSGGYVSREITVIDNDGPAMTLTTASATWMEGSTGRIITVERNTPTTSPLTVTLSSDHDELFEYTPTIVIPAGSTSARFSINVLANETSGDSTTAVFTATAEGHSIGTCWVQVSDQTLPDTVVTALEITPQNVEVGSPAQLSVTLANKGVAPIEASSDVAIYADGSSTALTRLYLQTPLAPGATTTLSKQIDIELTPGTHTLTAEANPNHNFAELTYVNNRSASTTFTVTPGFTATVTTDKSAYAPGETVKISGKVNGSRAANSKVEVYVIDSSRRAIEAVSDGSGNFTAEWTPYQLEGGHFVVGACWPGEKLTTPMAEIDIHGIAETSGTYITCKATVGEPFQGQLEMRNLSRLAATGISVSAKTPEGCSIEFDAPSTVAGDAQFTVPYVINSTAPSSGNKWEQIEVTVTTAEGVELPVTLNYYCYQLHGQLKASVSRIDATMTMGEPRDYSFKITNIGQGSTGAVTLSLPAFIKSITPVKINSLERGDTATVVLRINPRDDMQLNIPVTGSIGINCERGKGLALPFSIEPVSETMGTLRVDVCDENTYYTAEAPHLAGATVKVTHPTTGALIGTATTDANGCADFTVAEGWYDIFVTADRHDCFRGNVMVNPGRTTVKTVNLSIQAITVNWEVVETEIEDEYDIKTKLIYETNVPVPVVETVMPDSLNIADLAVGESLLFTASLTNKGLITARDVNIELPPLSETKSLVFEYLTPRPMFDLAPHQNVQIPVRVRRIATPDSPNDAPSRADRPSRLKSYKDIPCYVNTITCYYWDCGNDRKWHRVPFKVKLGAAGLLGCVKVSYDTISNGLPLPSPQDGEGLDIYYYYEGPKPVPGEPQDCEPCVNKNLLKTVDLAAHLNPYTGAVADFIKGHIEGADDDDDDEEYEDDDDPTLWGDFKDLSSSGWDTAETLEDPDASRLKKTAAMTKYASTSAKVAAHWTDGSKEIGETLFNVAKGLEGADNLNQYLKDQVENPDWGRALSDGLEVVGDWIDKKVTDALPPWAQFIKGMIEMDRSCDINGDEDAEEGEEGDEEGDGDKDDKLSYMGAPAKANAAGSIGYIKGMPNYFYPMYNEMLTCFWEQLSILGAMTDYYGDPSWVYIDNKESQRFVNTMIHRLDENGMVPQNRIADLVDERPDFATEEMALKLIERHNNSVSGNGDPNSMDYENASRMIKRVRMIEDFAQRRGYDNTHDLLQGTYNVFFKEASDPKNSVCTHLQLTISQKMVMTRQAFRGTLTVTNGSESKPMTDVKLTLLIRDKFGNIATSHEFAVSPESIDGFEGDLDLESGWSLAPKSTGTAEILFIPTKNAAPTVDMVYSFGGSLSYTDPFTGLTVKRDLFPVSLTVKPSPVLDLTYFMQRDIIGDDPMTDEVEPIVPAEFALLISNIGNGDATRVAMTTEQPEITRNDKDLLIEFELLSSQLNGGEKSLALGGNSVVDFGNIPAHSTAYAQWWLTSSLTGHFTSYKVEATHVTAFGNPELSLLNDVTIHELIHSVEVDDLRGFLVNDLWDYNDTPDIIYLTDGSTADVSAVSSADISGIGGNTYSMKVETKRPGWAYGSVADPTAGRAKLSRVTRMSDGKEIPLQNFWQTDRTMRDRRDPIYENLLHFADEILGMDETYLIEFAPMPVVALAVHSVAGLPAEGAHSETPVGSVTVTFNKDVDPTTFTADDLTLTCQGAKLDAGRIAIAQIAPNVFTLDLSELTAVNGYYNLTIQTASIIDTEGFGGAPGTNVGWTQYQGGEVTVNVSVTPEASGAVTPKENVWAHNSLAVFTATPAKGYIFSRWIHNGQTLSTAPRLQFTADADADLVAEFTPCHYNLFVDYEALGGTVDGGATGKYIHGTELTLSATPSSGWNFDGWLVNGEPFSADSELSLCMESDNEVTAVFTNSYTSFTYNLNKGWNWVTPLTSTSVSGFLSTLGSNVETMRDGQSADGNIAGLSATKGYKLKMVNDLSATYSGRIPTPDKTPLTLAAGWNSIGYLPTSQMSVADALCGISAQNNDIIKGFNGFAVYTSGGWTGTLTQLEPGHGYSYSSSAAQSFTYPRTTVLTSVVVSRSKPAYVAGTPWQVNAPAYPDNMAVIAVAPSDPEHTIVGAFVGDECRGIGQVIDDRLFITVHGDFTVDSKVTFRAIDTMTGVTSRSKESVDFAESSGSYEAPVPLDFYESDGIEGAVSDADARFVVAPNPVADVLKLRGPVEEITCVMAFGLSGQRVIDEYDYDADAGIDASRLASGHYLLLIETPSGNSLLRFIKR